MLGLQWGGLSSTLWSFIGVFIRESPLKSRGNRCYGKVLDLNLVPVRLIDSVVGCYLYQLFLQFYCKAPNRHPKFMG